MQTRIVLLGGGLAVLLLAAGCQTAPTAADQNSEDLMHVESSSVEVLGGALAQAGMTDSNLVLETTITLPPPAAGDAHPKPSWKGLWAGQSAPALQADDRMLVVAKSIPCDVPEAQYKFNPFTRTWSIQAGTTNPEGNWLRVIFTGTAREFVAAAAASREQQSPLASLAADAKGAAGFPMAATVDGVLADLTELGLSRLSAHLRGEHADRSCNPDIHVYVKPAAGR